MVTRFYVISIILLFIAVGILSSWVGNMHLPWYLLIIIAGTPSAILVGIAAYLEKIYQRPFLPRKGQLAEKDGWIMPALASLTAISAINIAYDIIDHTYLNKDKFMIYSALFILGLLLTVNSIVCRKQIIENRSGETP